MTERQRARPQTARARISNPVSGGQCHLNHLTTLRSSVCRRMCAYTLLRRVLIHADCRWPSPTLPLYEMITCFIKPNCRLGMILSVTRQCLNGDSVSSHHPHEVLLAQFSLYVHKGGLKPDSFHLHGFITWLNHSHSFITWLHHVASSHGFITWLHSIASSHGFIT